MEHLTEVFHRLGNQSENCHAQEYQCYQINGGQTGVDSSRHNDRNNQRNRCTHAHTENHLVSVLQVGYIGGKSCYQSCGGILINVGKGEGLDVGIHRLSQVFGKTGGCPRTVFASHNSGKQTDSGNHYHQCAANVNVPHVARCHAIVNDGCHEQGNNHFHDYL